MSKLSVILFVSIIFVFFERIFSAGAPTSAAFVRIGLSANKAPVTIYNDFGGRPITSVHLEESFRKSEKTSYAHAIFHSIPSSAVYRDIVRIGKIRKVGGFVIRQDGEVYEQWTVNLLGQDINKVRERLAKKFPRLFFNLEPYTLDDKLTSKTGGVRRSVSASATIKRGKYSFG